ncbi:MAG TPA: carbonic anhydrase, partial [Streptomyces sp.]|nr:carbonic anhydrase [Streptomyces sp.]
PGDLFELRTAGNIVPAYSQEQPAGEVATIEYALCVLGVRHIVVCGHSHCGAVGAMVRGDDLSAVPAVRSWLDDAAPEQLRRSWTDAAAGGSPDPGPDLTEHVQSHVLAQLERLRAYPCVREGVAAGRLTLHAWFYEVHTGAVRSHQPRTGTFQPL